MPQQQAIIGAVLFFFGLLSMFALSLGDDGEIDCTAARQAYAECIELAHNYEPGACAEQQSRAFQCEVDAEGGAREPVAL